MHWQRSKMQCMLKTQYYSLTYTANGWKSRDIMLSEISHSHKTRHKSCLYDFKVVKIMQTYARIMVSGSVQRGKQGIA